MQITHQTITAILRKSGYTASKQEWATVGNTRIRQMTAGYKIGNYNGLYIECAAYGDACKDTVNTIIALLAENGITAREYKNTGIIRLA